MRYISDDNKVFNTEQECCEHEQKLKQKMIERAKQKERYDNICKHHRLLIEEISSYVKDYSLTAEKVYDKFGNILCSLYKFGC